MLATALTMFSKILALILPLLGGKLVVFFSWDVEEAVSMAAESAKCKTSDGDQQSKGKWSWNLDQERRRMCRERRGDFKRRRI